MKDRSEIGKIALLGDSSKAPAARGWRRQTTAAMTRPMSSQPTAAQSLARFICGLNYRHIPAGAVSRCRELLLDQLGCQLIGAGMPWNQPVANELRGGFRSLWQERFMT